MTGFRHVRSWPCATTGLFRLTTGHSTVEIATPVHSTWLDKAKARALLDWRPMVNFEGMIEPAWTYAPPENQPRKVWYPG